MSTDRRNLQLLLVGRDVSAGKVLKDLSGQAAKTESRFSSLARNAKYAAGAAALGAIGMVARTGFKELEDYQSGLAQVTAALKSTHGAAGITAPQIEKLAHQIQNYSGQTDDSIVSTAALLLRFRNLRDEAGRGNDVFSQTVKVAADMAARLGGDAASQATKLGRALNDPIKGMTALTRVGVTLTDQQKAVVTQLVASGRVMDAQKIILGELQRQYGGSARAAGETLAGKIAIAQRHFEDFSQEIVGDALPVITRFATALDQMKGVLIPLGLAVGGAIAAWKAYQLIVKGVMAVTTMYRTVVLNLATAYRVAQAEGTTLTATLRGLATAEVVATAGLAAIGIGLGLLVNQFFAAREAQRKMRDEADSFVSGLDMSTSSLGSMRQGLTDIASKMKETTQLLGGQGQGIIKNSAYYKELQAQYDATAGSIRTMRSNERALAMQHGISRTRVEELAAANGIDLTGALDRVREKLDAAMAAAKLSHHPTKEAAQDFKSLGDESRSASEQVQALRNALDLLAGKALSTDDAVISFRNDIKDLADSLKKSHGEMDLNTQKSRDARQSFNDTAQAALDYTASVKDSTGSNKKAAAALRESIKALKDVAGSSPHAQKMLDRLRGALDRLTASGHDSGKNLDTGVASGIDDYSHIAIAAAIRMAQGVAKAARGVSGFRISSPSKVFRKMGHQINEGLGAGIDDMSSLPVNRLRSLVGKMKDYIGSEKNGLDRAAEDATRGLLNTLSKTLDRYDAVRSRLATVRGNAAQFGGGIRDSLIGAVDVTQAKIPTSTYSVIGYLRRQRSGLRQFRRDLDRLRDRGVDKRLIDQLAQAGVENAGGTAHALAVQASRGDIAQINRLSLAIRRNATAIGRSRARADYGPKIDRIESRLRDIRQDLRHLRPEIRLRIELDGKQITAYVKQQDARSRRRKGKDAEAA